MRISSTHCDGKLEGREVWDIDGQRRTPFRKPCGPCPIRPLPSHTDSWTSNDLKDHLPLLSDPGTAPQHAKVDSPELGPRVCQ